MFFYIIRKSEKFIRRSKKIKLLLFIMDTSRKWSICVGPGTPNCVGLWSDGKGLDADDLELICVVCRNDADVLAICVAPCIRCDANWSSQPPRGEQMCVAPEAMCDTQYPPQHPRQCASQPGKVRRSLPLPSQASLGRAMCIAHGTRCDTHC